MSSCYLPPEKESQPSSKVGRVLLTALVQLIGLLFYRLSGSEELQHGCMRSVDHGVDE